MVLGRVIDLRMEDESSGLMASNFSTKSSAENEDKKVGTGSLRS